MISFIIPAHNEERWIGRCLQSIRQTMEALGEPYEMIVVDDASTDSTAQLAQEGGAKVLQVDLRKISAVRNTGAQAAQGEMFFFVDADTRVNAPAVGAALQVMRSGGPGGGCVFEFDGPVPWWGAIIHAMATVMARLIRWVGGCFIFCTRPAYQSTGGFSEKLYAGEDIAFVQALKKVGRFVVLKPKVVTSARKLSVVGPWDVIKLIATIAVRGPRYEGKWVRDILYGRRAQDSKRIAKVH
jgi:glycosyltransferase involved in cell wall biosynthesis